MSFHPRKSFTADVVGKQAQILVKFKNKTAMVNKILEFLSVGELIVWQFTKIIFSDH